MVPDLVPGFGMDQNVKAPAMHHQPGDDLGEFLGRKRRLKHRLGMGPHRRIPPSANLHGETCGQSFAHDCCVGAARFVEIDVSVITRDGRHAPHVPSTAAAGRNLFLANNAVGPKQVAKRQAGPRGGIGKQSCFGQPSSGLHGGDGVAVVSPETKLQVLIDGTEVIRHASSPGFCLAAKDAPRATRIPVSGTMPDTSVRKFR